MNENATTLQTTIAKYILTQSQLEFLADAAHRAQKNLNTTTSDPANSFSNLPARENSILTTLWQVNDPTQKNLNGFLTSLQTLLSQVTYSTLALSYRPTLPQIKEISQLLRSKLNSNLILKIEYQPDLTTGFILEHAGKRYDFSLAQQLTT